MKNLLKIIVRGLFVSSLMFFLQPGKALAVQYPSSTYCQMITAFPTTPYLANESFDMFSNAWGVTGNSTYLGVSLKSLPADLVNGGIVERWNFGEDTNWYSSTRTQANWHTYNQTGDYTVSYFRGNSSNGNYLICKGVLRTYSAENKDGFFPVVSNGIKTRDFTGNGKIGGIFYKTSNYLQNNGTAGCLMTNITSSPSLYNYSRGGCYLQNLTWRANLSKGVDKVTVSISQQLPYGPGYGMVISEVKLFTRTQAFVFNPSLHIPDGFTTCSVKEEIKQCCYWQNGKFLCNVVSTPVVK